MPHVGNLPTDKEIFHYGKWIWLGLNSSCDCALIPDYGFYILESLKLAFCYDPCSSAVSTFIDVKYDIF